MCSLNVFSLLFPFPLCVCLCICMCVSACLDISPFITFSRKSPERETERERHTHTHTRTHTQNRATERHLISVRIKHLGLQLYVLCVLIISIVNRSMLFPWHWCSWGQRKSGKMFHLYLHLKMHVIVNLPLHLFKHHEISKACKLCYEVMCPHCVHRSELEYIWKSFAVL